MTGLALNQGLSGTTILFGEELKRQLQECDDNSAIGKFIIVVQNCSKLRVIFKRWTNENILVYINAVFK